MDLFAEIKKKARANPCRVVLPEGDEGRVIDAAKIIEREGIAKLILGSGSKCKLEKSQDFDKVVSAFYELRKHKGISLDDAKQMILEDPVYYAAMLVRLGLADGFVAGASISTRNVAKAAIHCLRPKGKKTVVASAFIMKLNNRSLGHKGIFIFADCGIVPDPSPEELADIANSAGKLLMQLFDTKPKIAMLSYSSKGSASGPLVERVAKATEIAKSQAPDFIIDGELQLDAAVVPEVAARKAAASPVGGCANVLIFPDLNSGNIGYKLTQRMAGAKAVGPLFLGLISPASDLSRGCSVEDIVDAVAVTVVRAQHEVVV